MCIPAPVPFFIGHGAQISEFGKACPACVGDYAVDAAERGDGVSDAAGAVFEVGGVGLDYGGFDPVGGFDFFGEVAGGFFAVGVVDGDVTSFGGEFADDFGAEASGGRISRVC